MSSVAVSLVRSDGESVSGILVADPKVGQDLRIFVGANDFFYIPKVRGWIKLCGATNCILFDKDGKRYRLSVIASSEDFS